MSLTATGGALTVIDTVADVRDGPKVVLHLVGKAVGPGVVRGRRIGDGAGRRVDAGRCRGQAAQTIATVVALIMPSVSLSLARTLIATAVFLFVVPYHCWPQADD